MKHARFTEHQKLIEAFGGHAALAQRLNDRFGDDPGIDAARKWPSIGIPWKWRPRVAVLALETGTDLPEGFVPKELLKGASQHQSDTAENATPLPCRGFA